ncbi:hypothetical protein V8D89_000134 [Ganoderma adspersum]
MVALFLHHVAHSITRCPFHEDGPYLETFDKALSPRIYVELYFDKLSVPTKVRKAGVELDQEGLFWRLAELDTNEPHIKNADKVATALWMSWEESTCEAGAECDGIHGRLHDCLCRGSLPVSASTVDVIAFPGITHHCPQQCRLRTASHAVHSLCLRPNFPDIFKAKVVLQYAELLGVNLME